MAKVVVTGGSGFIGTNLVQYHLDLGDEVMSIDVLEPRNPEHSRCYRQIDILEEAPLTKAFCDFSPDVVYHLAARTDIDGETIKDYKANTDGMRSVLRAAQGAKVPRLIVSSSQLVCPMSYVPKDDFDVNPPNAYGESKVETERILRNEAGSLSWVLVRPTTIYGPWFGVKYQGLYRTVKAGRYMHPMGKHIQKVWGFVGNTVYSLDKLAKAPADQVVGKTFYLADYEPYDLLDYASRIQRVFKAPKIRQIPYVLLKSLALFGDLMLKMGRYFPLQSYRLSNLMTNMRVSVKPLSEVVGPLPYSLDDAVTQTITWIEAHPDFARDSSLH